MYHNSTQVHSIASDEDITRTRQLIDDSQIKRRNQGIISYPRSEPDIDAMKHVSIARSV
jgi:hypothetical protein